MVELAGGTDHFSGTRKVDMSGTTRKVLERLPAGDARLRGGHQEQEKGRIGDTT